MERSVRIVAAIGMCLSLSGCLAAAGAVGSAALVGATTSSAKSQANELNRQLMRSEIEAALDIGKRRHPDVFARMTADDDEFYCLFQKEYPTYVGLIRARGEQRAAQIAIDNAAKRSRDGECGETERFLNSINPFNMS